MKIYWSGLHSSETHNLQAVFSSYLVHKTGIMVPGNPSRDLVRKLGIRIIVWPKPHMFREESLGKINAIKSFFRTGQVTNSIAWKLD